MKNSYSNFPWIGFALVVVSIVATINSCRLAYLSTSVKKELNEVRKIAEYNSGRDAEITNAELIATNSRNIAFNTMHLSDNVGLISKLQKELYGIRDELREKLSELERKVER